MNSYNLSRHFWDFAFENPDLIKPVHVAIYFFAVEHCNRLGWKKKIGLPTSMVLDAIGIKSYRVYKKAFDNLVEWEFFIVHQYSKNQYSSNIVALNEKANAESKALDNALSKHGSKHGQYNKTSNKEQVTKEHSFLDFDFNPKFKQVLTEWFDYKKSRKQEYKNSNSREKLYKKLLNLSGGDVSVAQKIVDDSMANNWSGLFEPKGSPSKSKSEEPPEKEMPDWLKKIRYQRFDENPNWKG